MHQSAIWLTPASSRPPTATPDLTHYDRIIVMLSGGVDSVACVLEVLAHGVARSQIEVWHQCIDGQNPIPLMDWPITPAYCRAVAQALGVPLFTQWREGGFEREMLRTNAPTAPTYFDLPGGGVGCAGGHGPPGTRNKFPMPCGDLRIRWCSAYLKIDVAALALRNQARFDHQHTLVVTGERADESAQRARYAAFEPHRSDARTGPRQRHVDHWRPILSWSKADVWAVLARQGLVAHPAYDLGWGRCSCSACIFGSDDQWSSLRVVAPAQFARIAAYEQQFGVTVRNGMSVGAAADRGTPFAAITPQRAALATGRRYLAPVLVATDQWRLPAGASGDRSGPL